jgi:hypothetical protein
VSLRTALRPRSVRSRLLLTVVVSVGGALVLMTAGFNLLLWRGLSNDANALVRSRAAAEAGSVDVVNDRVVPPEVPDTGGMGSQSWLFVDGRYPRSHRRRALGEGSPLCRAGRRRRQAGGRRRGRRLDGAV